MFVRLHPASRLSAVFAGFPRAYWFLLGGMLITGLGNFVLPFETIYLVSIRHLPISQASAIVALYGIGSCLAAMGGGLLADKIGRRPTMIAGLFLWAVVTFLLAFARTPMLIAGLSFALGCCISLYRPASSAAIADLIPSADQARANSLLYWAFNLGIGFSPLLASLVIMHSGYVLLFCADAITTLIFCALVVIGVPETRPVLAIPRPMQRKPTRGSTSILRDPVFLVFTLLMFGLTCIYFQSQSTLPIDMQLHGLSTAQYGLAIAVNGIVVIALGLPLSHLLTHWSPFRALAGAALLLGGGFGLTALAGFLGSLSWYAGSILIWTLGEILFSPTSDAVVAQLSPVKQRGLYQGIARTSWGLSGFVGPLVGGLVLMHWGALLWISSAVLGIGTAGGFVLIGTYAHHQQSARMHAIRARYKYPVELTNQQRRSLEQLVKTRSGVPASVRLHAQIVLLSDCNAGMPQTTDQIATALFTTQPTITNTRRRLSERGFDVLFSCTSSSGSHPKRVLTPTKLLRKTPRLQLASVG